MRLERLRHLTKNRLIQNTVTLMLGSGGSALLALLLSILIGRVLGEDGLGVYASALAWVFPLSLVAEFGIGTWLIRELARSQSPEYEKLLLRTAVLARLLIGGFMLVMILIFAPFLSDNPLVVTGIRISAPLVIVNPFYGVFTAIFRARRVMTPIAILNTGMLASQVILTALVFASGYGILVALAVNTLTSSGQLLMAWAVWRWWFRSTQEQPDISTGMLNPPPLLHTLRQTFPFALASVLAAVQMRVAFIMLEGLADAAVVGLFAAAMRFVDGGRLLPQAFFDALFPRLSGLAKSPEKFGLTFRRSTMAVIWYALIFAVLITPFAPFLIRLTYGEQFTASASILTLLAWALLPQMLKYIRTLYWYARGGESYVNAMTFVAIFVQITVGLWLIPSQGASGAVWAIIAGESTGAALLWIRVRGQ